MIMKLWIARDKQDYLGLYYMKPTWRKHGLSQTEDWYNGGFLGYLDNSELMVKGIIKVIECHETRV